MTTWFVNQHVDHIKKGEVMRLEGEGRLGGAMFLRSGATHPVHTEAGLSRTTASSSMALVFKLWSQTAAVASLV